jgi:hypothetical protein
MALSESLAEGHSDYEAVVHESIDSVMPVYYTDIVNEWVEAGMPQPDDHHNDIIADATDSDSALKLVLLALGVRKGYSELAQAIVA